MATEDEITDAVDELNQAVSDVVDDTARWSQDESAQIFEEVASTCRMRAETIRQEMSG